MACFHLARQHHEKITIPHIHTIKMKRQWCDVYTAIAMGIDDADLLLEKAWRHDVELLVH